MEISTQSWHWRFNMEYYRVMKEGDFNDIEWWSERGDHMHALVYFGKSLCAYFWGTIGRLIWTLITLCLIGGASCFFTHALIMEPLFMFIAQWMEGDISFSAEYAPLLIVTGFLMVVGIFGLIMIAHEKATQGGKSIIPEYIKARKNKWCPTLTVKVENEGK